MTVPPPLLLFDGHCLLCIGAVRWLIARDPQARLRFAPLTWPAAQPYLAGLAALPDSVVLVDAAGVHTKSTAALRAARLLRFPWPLLAALGWVVPRPLRDALYDLVARNRARWFGQQPECMVPTERDRSRFLVMD